MLEVELKFLIAAASLLRTRLEGLGAVAGDAVTQSDAYYNHPARDFAVTDEALRIRTVVDFDGAKESRVTYKGPKQGPVGNVIAKTRFEIELPLAEQTADGWAEVLTKLGFLHVATVTKRRTVYTLQRTGRRFEVSVDEVDRHGTFAEVETLAEQTADGWAEVLKKLGFLHVATVTKRRTVYTLQRIGRRFEVSVDEVDRLGTFAEVETLAEAEDREAAEQAVHALAAELDLSAAEGRSYLELLLGLG